MRVPLLPLTVAALGVSLACSRVPAEPAPGPASATSMTASAEPKATTVPPPTAPSAASAPAALGSTGAASPRCVVPLAPVAPPIPPPAAGAACPVDPEMGGPRLATAEVAFPEAPAKPRVSVELATKPHDIERGLMYRRAMAEDKGMLFRLDARRVHTFWMQNTCIPLDMLFVDEDGTIVGVSEAARPLDESIRSVPCPSLYVLEVNAGWVRKHGVAPGQKMTIPASAR